MSVGGRKRRAGGPILTTHGQTAERATLARVPLLGGRTVPAETGGSGPIAFVSTVAPDGVRNLAPFSFFNAVCADPPVVCISITVRRPSKDTLANIRATGDFVVNIVSDSIAAQMNLCAGEYPAEVDEFEVSGLTPVASDLVRRPRVGGAPGAM